MRAGVISDFDSKSMTPCLSASTSPCSARVRDAAPPPPRCASSRAGRGLGRFAVRERGQDLMEYTLLLAFVTLGIAAILVSAGQSVNSIWTTANSHLEKGHEYAKEHGK